MKTIINSKSRRMPRVSYLPLLASPDRRSPRGHFAVWLTLVFSFFLLAAPLHAQFVYVATANGVAAFSIGSNGAVTAVSGSPFPAGSNPVAVTLDPRAKFVYVVNQGDNTVSGYSIGSDGALTAVAGSPFPTGNQPTSVVVDPTAKFAYVGNQADNTVSGYIIGLDGALTPVPGSPFTAGSGPSWMAVDPTAKFVYVANFYNADVWGYSIGSNGALTPVPGSPFEAGSQPFSVVVDPNGKFVYVVNLGDSDVSAYSIGKGGGLTPVPGSPFSAGRSPYSIVIDPTAKFAYVANANDNTVSGYRISSNGALNPVKGSPFPTGYAPVSVGVDPTAQFAYTADRSENSLSAYSIRSNGALKPVAGSPFPAGNGLASLAITPVTAEPVTTNLVLWLKADAGLAPDGSTWADQSGQNHNASALSGQSPTVVPGAFNGLPAVQFGGGQALSIAWQVLTSQQFTIVAVVTDNTTKKSSYTGFREIFSNWDASNQETSVYLGTTGGSPITMCFTDDIGGATDPLHMNTGVGRVPAPRSGFVLTGVSGNLNASLYLNGKKFYKKPSALSSRVLSTSFYIGDQGSGALDYWNGDIEEILVYDSALNSAQFRQDSGYLAAKYGISFP